MVEDEKMVSCDVAKKFRFAYGATRDAQLVVSPGEQELPESAARWAKDNGFLAETEAPAKKAK